MKSLNSIIISLVLAVSLMIGASSVNAQVSENQVSLNDVQKVAEYLIANNEYDSWKEAVLKLSAPVYNLDDEVIGYYYSVNKNKDGVGYIIVASTKELPPILQYGDQGTLSKVDQNLEIGNKFYYLGALNYKFGKSSNKIKEDFSDSKEKLLAELKNQGLENTEDYEKLKNMQLNNLIKDPEKYKKSWDLVLGQTTQINEIREAGTATTQSYELSVPRVWQRTSGVTWPSSSCGPATGAMLAKYWKSLGYNITTFSNDADLINDLYRDMNTGPLGTSVTGFANGLIWHFSLTSSNWYNNTYTGLGNFDNYEDSINRGRPVGLRFDSNSDPNAYTSYHFVAGVGYNWIGEEGYAGVKDPDGGEYNTSTHYFSWGINSQYINMITIWNGQW